MNKQIRIKLLTMKKFIQETIKEQIKNDETTAISFNRFDGASGHIQFHRNEWAIFFQCACVHVSKTLQSAVKKLDQLDVRECDLFISE